MSQNKKRFSLDEDSQEDVYQQEEAPQAGGEAYEDDEDYASSERYEEDKLRVVDFLQYPREKRKLKEFLEETYKAYEQESVDRMINRVVHEHESEMRGSTPWHKPGHIGSLMYEYLNMIGVEAGFVSGLQHTKSSLTKTVQNRVDEINTLLRGVGGFNRQIKASFSRSAVVYLEQEDPYHKHRERVIFTVNLGDFELRYNMGETAAEDMTADGRSYRRLVWDEAVNTLAEIVSNTGMKPKYVKNDKNSCIFTMKQDLLSTSEKTPDEFFTFDLRYMNNDMREGMAREYVSKVAAFNAEIKECKRKSRTIFGGSAKRSYYAERAEIAEKERDYYIATHPDPREMDDGLIFSIAVNTLKDYSVTKDKMQVIMTKYILALSKIATDKSMDQQVNTVFQFNQSKPQNFQDLEGVEGEEQGGGDGQRVVVMKDDLKKKVSGGRR